MAENMAGAYTDETAKFLKYLQAKYDLTLDKRLFDGVCLILVEILLILPRRAYADR